MEPRRVVSRFRVTPVVHEVEAHPSRVLDPAKALSLFLVRRGEDRVSFFAVLRRQRLLSDRFFAEGVNATYIVLFSLLVLFFSFFWVATQFNAMRIADDFKLNGSYVPGIRPGLATAEFLDHTMSRVTLIGAIGLIFVAIFPTLLRSYLNLPWEMASFFGGTSLLIIVGVALDTLRQMESLLVMRHYDGFLKHGRIQSRMR